MSATRRRVLARTGGPWAQARRLHRSPSPELFAGTAAAQSPGHTGATALLIPDPDGLALDLPRGFRCTGSCPARA